MTELLTPVWLLDIDGTVNATMTIGRAAHPQDHNPARETAWPAGVEWLERRGDEFGGERYALQAAVPLLDYIRLVHREQLAEIRWLTTWREGAKFFAALMDLPDMPVEMEMPGTGYSEWWKLKIAQRVLYTERRPLVWADDDIFYNVSRAVRRSMAKDGALLISPTTSLGLMESEVQLIDRYIRRSHPDNDSPALTSADGMV